MLPHLPILSHGSHGMYAPGSVRTDWEVETHRMRVPEGSVDTLGITPASLHLTRRRRAPLPVDFTCARGVTDSTRRLTTSRTAVVPTGGGGTGHARRRTSGPSRRAAAARRRPSWRG